MQWQAALLVVVSGLAGCDSKKGGGPEPTPSTSAPTNPRAAAAWKEAECLRCQLGEGTDPPAACVQYKAANAAARQAADKLSPLLLGSGGHQSEIERLSDELGRLQAEVRQLKARCNEACAPRCQ